MQAVKLYSKFDKLPQVLNKSIINKKLKYLKLKPGENIFEFGCGTGGSTRILHQYIPHNYNKFIATDKLLVMINQAKLEHNNLNNVQFVPLDITIDEKDIKKDWIYTFDKTFSFLALNWIEQEMQWKVFRNINRLMKIGGYTFMNVIADTPVYEAYRELYQNPRWSMYMQNEREFVSPYDKYTKNRIENMHNVLKANHLNLMDLEFMDVCYQFGSDYEFKNFIKAVNPFIWRLPSELHDAYWEDLWKAHAKLSNVFTTGEFVTTLLFICAEKVRH